MLTGLMGSDIPVAIDDHVQAVWRDSLIYVITGWSNTTNVTNVQIYNPSEDTWHMGTPVPNDMNYRVFGGSGTIVDDTIYYAGGARFGFNFPAGNALRKGAINPEDPFDISWSFTSDAQALGYRMAAVDLDGVVYWIGGSGVTYNFDADAYNGSGIVEPLDRLVALNTSNGGLQSSIGLVPKIMDLRGAGKLDGDKIVIAGGIGQNAEVSNQTYLISLKTTSTGERPKDLELVIWPNPASDFTSIRASKPVSGKIFDLNGRLISVFSSQMEHHFNVESWSSGIYFCELQHENAVWTKRIVVK